jgi:murein DD-endopeptidase MepM/ murein hydrolase activator NlpD
VVKIINEIAEFICKIFEEIPRSNMVLALGLIFIILTSMVLPDRNSKYVSSLVFEKIALPLTSLPSEPTEQTERLYWQSERVGDGDNLSMIFQRAQLTAKDVYQVSSSPKGGALKNLYPGESLRFGINEKGILKQVHHIKSKLETHIYTLSDQKYTMEIELRQPEIVSGYREGVIRDSLYLAGKKANLPDKLIMELANIFGWDIDFVFDIRPGDSFSVLFEDRFIDGEKLSEGNIIAASFVNRKKTYNAVRYTAANGQSSYFTPEGLSMRKAFLRTPLDIFRISSGFNLRRQHPIHKKIKAHRGVDYAAPRGTPVYATGAGKVIGSGYDKYNGNFVFIQHGQTYTTKYIHLHNRKVRKGQTVTQRQLIGSVGSTGYSTGNHLHYEFLVNGIHRNPRTVKLPQAKPISVKEMEDFNRVTKPMLAQLAKYQLKTQIASMQLGTSNAL